MPTTGSLAPISIASIIIGFVSFAFTLATFLRVIWGNLQTLSSAPQEIEDALGSIKQALYEERTHLRIIRRRCRGDYEEGPYRVLNDALRHLIKQFKKLEEPFLIDPSPQFKHSRSNSYSNGNEKRRDRLPEDQQEPDDYYNVRYKRVSLRMRWLWLTHRDGVMDVSRKLQVMQTRRMSRQLTIMAAEMKFVSNAVLNIEEEVGGEGGRSRRGAVGRRGG